MSTKKMLVLFGTLIVATAFMAACAGAEGPAGPAGDMAELACSDCHNDTAVISAKVAAQGMHPHTTGRGWYYAGGRDGCAGCHSGASFPTMVESGVIPDDSVVVDVSPIDCRACHQVHTSYTADDWALTVEAESTALYAFEGATFEGGTGNLCASCHQPRRPIAEADADGNIEITSTHYGPHHGPQSAVMMGVGGAGPEAEGSPGAHYSMVENTCVSCHLGEDSAHTFEPTVAACQGCHADIEDLDVNGLQTEVHEMLDTLLENLVANGLMAIVDGEPHPVPQPGAYPAEQTQAAWNYILLSYEDHSYGVHNPAYTKALLEWSISVFE